MRITLTTVTLLVAFPFHTAMATVTWNCCAATNDLCVSWNEREAWVDISYAKVSPAFSERFPKAKIRSFDEKKIEIVVSDGQSSKNIFELKAMRPPPKKKLGLEKLAAMNPKKLPENPGYKVQSGFIVIDSKAINLENLVLTCEGG